jgi:hypothetical protein
MVLSFSKENHNQIDYDAHVPFNHNHLWLSIHMRTLEDVAFCFLADLKGMRTPVDLILYGHRTRYQISIAMHMLDAFNKHGR